jgi:hypothetical protein
VLRINFRSARGDAPTLMLAACLRFSADGTLRGPDNYVIGRCLDGCWEVAGRKHRELECEGPVRVRVKLGEQESLQVLGPFRQLRTCGGLLYGDDACLNILMPGRACQPDGVRPSSMTFEGGTDAKT